MAPAGVRRFLSSVSGLTHFRPAPTACAVGCILTPPFDFAQGRLSRLLQTRSQERCNISNLVWLRGIGIDCRRSWHPSRIVGWFLDWWNCGLWGRHRVGVGKCGSCHGISKMRENYRRSSDRRNDWKKPLPRARPREWKSFTGVTDSPRCCSRRCYW